MRKKHVDGLKQMIGLLKEKGSEGREYNLFEAWHGEGGKGQHYEEPLESSRL